MPESLQDSRLFREDYPIWNQIKHRFVSSCDLMSVFMVDLLSLVVRVTFLELKISPYTILENSLSTNSNWNMRGSRKFYQRGSNFDKSFLRGETIQANTIISRPSSARQQNAISMAFRWHADNGPKLNAGLVALWLFRGSGPV